ncbi:predicted protein [Histoplasma capsulatum var. duboisii H88]|uniref:Predicted protein n=1 Tax=Ajellomyces capsulatus (strain H88) TaxID=544711 RepID=F0U6N1_AJEC8|nr:predicted protein [Histoplasma capsulatum var. duboisii H88]
MPGTLNKYIHAFIPSSSSSYNNNNNNNWVREYAPRKPWTVESPEDRCRFRSSAVSTDLLHHPPPTNPLHLAWRACGGGEFVKPLPPLARWASVSTRERGTAIQGIKPLSLHPDGTGFFSSQQVLHKRFTCH